ncbi:hypothetical protein F4677DRAFT_460136 [Hypoxylon crocopeplum]|nr:hypothetical protein F4677DRAFT_460136 [Hypoxylon crocopeplum]
MSLEDPIPEVPSSSPNEVSGPTVLLWMVYLSINAMAQPTGPIFGMACEPQCKVLRSSPVISAFNTIDMIASWRRFSIASSGSVRAAATQVLAERRTVENSNEPIPVDQALAYLKQLRSESGFRWLTFCLGVLPQVIKLFGSSGIP